jgi:alpha-D-ribose 1-methylphosphonate 5-triphosphate synthase subunit PhnG
MARLQPPLLLAASHDPLRITTRRRRPWDRILAKARSLTLDAQLAEGCAPDTDRLRMVRAEVLASPRARLELAQEWERVLAQSVRPATVRLARIPLQYQQIRAAEAGIRRLVGALRSAGAVNVQGAAMASLLLTDGTGPLYNPARSEDLRGDVNSAADHLDPLTLFQPA